MPQEAIVGAAFATLHSSTVARKFRGHGPGVTLESTAGRAQDAARGQGCPRRLAPAWAAQTAVLRSFREGACEGVKHGKVPAGSEVGRAAWLATAAAKGDPPSSRPFNCGISCRAHRARGRPRSG